MKYKRKETANGRVMFFVDGKMTAEKEIPESVLGQLEGDMELEIQAPTAASPDETTDQIPRSERKCFIDGKPGVFKKWLQLHEVYLCEEHKASLTTGEIVQKMREHGIIE